MGATSCAVLSPFASDVLEGLSRQDQKKLSPAWLYDDLGTCLFEAITLLPEYGLTRADERLLRSLSAELVEIAGTLSGVAELGSGSGKKTRLLLNAVRESQGTPTYRPIDVSPAALENCRQSLCDVADVNPVCATWIEGLGRIGPERPAEYPMLVLFLGSSIGNIDRAEIVAFLSDIRETLRPGDLLLLGADLVKPRDMLIAAYDDRTGVTAAFNRNVLGRMNRELGTNFDLRQFKHEVRWNQEYRRIEMHLVSRRVQTIESELLQASFQFSKGESIWTESSHKFEVEELGSAARHAGFLPLKNWIDHEWPFAEMLWRAVM